VSKVHYLDERAAHVNTKEDNKEKGKKKLKVLVSPPVSDHHILERANR